MTDISIIQGSILDFDGDAIVNPANSFLSHGGGLARVIAQGAKNFIGGMEPDLPLKVHSTKQAREADVMEHAWQGEQDAHPLIPTGGAGWTSAGALPYAGIIHAVGPVYGNGEFMEADLLEMAYTSALEVAQERGVRSLAFPAISCGIFGYPARLAAPIATTVASWGDDYGVERIAFYLFDDKHFCIFEEAAGALITKA